MHIGFALYWDHSKAFEDNAGGRWYFCLDGTCCKLHRGHVKKNPEEVKMLYRTVPRSSELEYARKSIALNSESAIVQALIATRTGITLSQDQLRYCAGRNATEGGAINDEVHQSPAERLVNYLCNVKISDTTVLLEHKHTVVSDIFTKDNLGGRLTSTAPPPYFFRYISAHNGTHAYVFYGFLTSPFSIVYFQSLSRLREACVVHFQSL